MHRPGIRSASVFWLVIAAAACTGFNDWTLGVANGLGTLLSVFASHVGHTCILVLMFAEGWRCVALDE